MKTTYTIEQVCEVTGLSRRTVRYYIQEGLLDPPEGRGRGGNYNDVHIGRIREIRSLQGQGWTLASIAKRLKADSDPAGATETPEIFSGPFVQEDDEDDGHPFKKGGPFSSGLPTRRLAQPEAAKRPAETEPGGARSVFARYAIADGIEIVVSRETEEKHPRKIQEIVRIATSVIQTKEKE